MGEREGGLCAQRREPREREGPGRLAEWGQRRKRGEQLQLGTRSWLACPDEARSPRPSVQQVGSARGMSTKGRAAAAQPRERRRWNVPPSRFSWSRSGLELCTPRCGRGGEIEGRSRARAVASGCGGAAGCRGTPRGKHAGGVVQAGKTGSRIAERARAFALKSRKMGRGERDPRADRSLLPTSE